MNSNWVKKLVCKDPISRHGFFIRSNFFLLFFFFLILFFGRTSWFCFGLCSLCSISLIYTKTDLKFHVRCGNFIERKNDKLLRFLVLFCISFLVDFSIQRLSWEKMQEIISTFYGFLRPFSLALFSLIFF